MRKVFKIEATISGDLAELYSVLLEEFGAKSEITPLELNRTLLQTGAIQHLLMMAGVGLLKEEKSQALQELIDKLAGQTIMAELVEIARLYWKNNTASGGTLDFKA